MAVGSASHPGIGSKEISSEPPSKPSLSECPPVPHFDLGQKKIKASTSPEAGQRPPGHLISSWEEGRRGSGASEGAGDALGASKDVQISPDHKPVCPSLRAGHLSLLPVIPSPRQWPSLIFPASLPLIRVMYALHWCPTHAAEACFGINRPHPHPHRRFI